MTKPFRPMLATDADLSKLRFPLYASPKLDGVRAIVRDGVVYSRSNKPIPNKYVQKCFSRFTHCDGELIVGKPTAHDVYRQTTSGVMSEKGEPDVYFHVFDHISGGEVHSWRDRYRTAENTLEAYDPDYSTGADMLEHVLIASIAELERYENKCLTEGYEGLILRDPNAPYKQGRSTVNEGYLLKLKRFQDAEAVVIGFEERMENLNAANVSELGYTKRSSHKAGKSGRGDLGALVCRTADGVEFNIGTGFTDADRASIWERRDQFLGLLAKYKFFPVGQKEAPRHPVFLGWRDGRDM